ncbi:group-specific protein [Heyndrickxia camelliae]|uniref:Group-specific protein n=1 Tax=Heyndrickxia camelliae TaxID=1707093 RepID=A0A2N3LHA2_9BACI|nr:group-specific protein [Heyndrickxia camelliae]PKR83991.1 group-specific protein [Heyndrickxia camelliae]
MRFYIASSFQNIEMVRELSSKLLENGFQQTYDWTQNDKTVGKEELMRIGTKEKEAVTNCDLFILLLPGGKGSHTELGIALGTGVPKIYILNPDIENQENSLDTTFYHLPEVEIHCGEVREFINIVL